MDFFPPGLQVKYLEFTKSTIMISISKLLNSPTRVKQSWLFEYLQKSKCKTINNVYSVKH